MAAIEKSFAALSLLQEVVTGMFDVFCPGEPNLVENSAFARGFAL